MADEFHLIGGNNHYVIVAEDGERHVKLECVLFISREDLGDGIYCDKEGEQIWVARYHFCHMLLVAVPCLNRGLFPFIENPHP